MPDLKEQAIALLASTVVADVQADAPTRNLIYTVPPGKGMIIDSLVIHSPTASLAGMDDVDFGGGALCQSPSWINNETGIGDMTDVDDFMILRADYKNTITDGDDAVGPDREFAALVTLGSTLAAGATFDLYGYLIDS